MPTFNRFSGDAQPVFALDINNGSQTGNIGSTAALVQMAGPKLDFFKVLVKDGSDGAIDLRDQLGGYASSVFNPGLVQQLTQAVQTVATVALYQVEGDANGQISYAVYPADAFTAGELQTALRALGNVQITSSANVTTGIDVAGTVVTEPGFKLA